MIFRRIAAVALVAALLVVGAPTAASADDPVMGTVPTISGGTAVGSVLTASPGLWGPEGVVLSYKWFRKDPRGGPTDWFWETTPTHIVSTDDLGYSLVVVVVGNDTSPSRLALSSSPFEIPLATMTAGIPVISGAPAPGSTLTASPGTWSPSDVTLTYQWLRASTASATATPILSATGSTYVVKDADLGTPLTVRIVGEHDGYAMTSAVSASVTVALPLPKPVLIPNVSPRPRAPVARQYSTLGTPSIAGEAIVGSRLTMAVTTSYLAASSVTVQWFRGTRPIPGATHRAYRLTVADAKYRIYVAAYAPSFPESVSPPTARVLLAFSTALPRISGDLVSGNTVKVTTKGWKPKASSVNYQWLANGKVIKKATKATLLLRKSLVGKRLTVRVTASHGGYATVERESKATREVAL